MKNGAWLAAGERNPAEIGVRGVPVPVLHASKEFLGSLIFAANSYTWTGASVIDVGWERNANWNPTVIPGTYPSTIGDDAFIPYTSGGYDVWLVNVTIDDVTITGDVDFSTGAVIATY